MQFFLLLPYHFSMASNSPSRLSEFWLIYSSNGKSPAEPNLFSSVDAAIWDSSDHQRVLLVPSKGQPGNWKPKVLFLPISFFPSSDPCVFRQIGLFSCALPLLVMVGCVKSPFFAVSGLKYPAEILCVNSWDFVHFPSQSHLAALGAGAGGSVKLSGWPWLHLERVFHHTTEKMRDCVHICSCVLCTSTQRTTQNQCISSMGQQKSPSGHFGFSCLKLSWWIQFLRNPWVSSYMFLCYVCFQPSWSWLSLE